MSDQKVEVPDALRAVVKELDKLNWRIDGLYRDMDSFSKRKWRLVDECYPLDDGD